MKKNLEITTHIGCKVLCKYCPQSKIVEAYGKLKSKNVMTLSDFKKILSNVDNKDTKLIFAGFSECFLNKDSVDMIIHAWRQGFKIDIFTTTVGLTKTKILKMKNAGVCFYAAAFHLFKSDRFFNKDKFYKIAKFFQDNIETRVFKIVEVRKIVSRAGALFKISEKNGKIICLNNFVYQNVVLPNGDLVLCCNDFALKHKLGNLFEDKYSSNKLENERKKILDLMKVEKSDMACRFCEMAVSDDKNNKIRFGTNKDFLKDDLRNIKRAAAVNKLKHKIKEKIKKENI
ncbi:MAG: hypothetical protein AB7E39_01185 [Endomicrobiaceae bacterium]